MKHKIIYGWYFQKWRQKILNDNFQHNVAGGDGGATGGATSPTLTSSYSSSTSSSCSLSPSPTPTPTSSPWKDKENDPVIVLQETLPSPILKGRKTFFGLSHVLLGLLSCFLAFSRSTNVLSVRGLFDLLSGSFWLSSFTFWSLIVHLISILGFHLSFWHFIVSFGLF